MTPLLSHLAALAAASLVATIWQTLLLTGCVALYLRLLPRSSGPEVRYTIWASLLPVILFLPLLSLAAGAAHPSGSPIVGSTSAPHPLLRLDAPWSIALATLWVALSLFRAVRLGLSALRLRSIARSAVPVSSPGAYTTTLSTNHHRSTTLCTTDSAEITQPSVVGLRDPRILIPSRMYAGLTPSDLNQIVLHELEHLRRGDDWMNLVQKLSLVLFPLNPGLLWVERRLCQERELACDNGVLRRTAAPKLYASCLVHLAEERIRFRQMPLALGAWARRSELAHRIDHILKSRTSTLPHPQATLATMTVFVCLLGGSALLSRSPQLVSFAPYPTAQPSADVALTVLSTGQVHALQFASASYTGQPHATLLRATMPSLAAAPQPPRVVARKRARLVTHRAARPLQGQQRLAVTVMWNEVAVGPHLVLTSDDLNEFSHTYAAVPAPGGWIFFQL